jgi:NAD(P)-dependent dehydrogenase (short-subunit alcohol dehydrogenase family)
MGERVAVVTGASSGLGKAAAMALARDGWRVIALGRDAKRSEAAAAEIGAAGKVDMLRANLSLMADAARVADEIAGLTDRVHLLVNNAGGMAKEKIITAEGYEENFAGNHLGPFLLTQKLLPLLKRAAQDAPKGRVRIVNTSSDASEMIPRLNFDDLQNLQNYSVGAAYCSAKLANVLHARALAQRLAGDGVIAHSFHPGTVDSNFISHAGEQTQAYMKTLQFVSAEEGADTLLWLATSDEAGKSSGGYWYKRAPRTPNPLIDDASAVQRLWDESEKLISKARI